MTLCRTYHAQRVTARTVSHFWFGVFSWQSRSWSVYACLVSLCEVNNKNTVSPCLPVPGANSPFVTILGGTHRRRERCGGGYREDSTALYCAILYRIVLPCTVHFGFAYTNDSNPQSAGRQSYLTGITFTLKMNPYRFNIGSSFCRSRQDGEYRRVWCHVILGDTHRHKE